MIKRRSCDRFEPEILYETSLLTSCALPRQHSWGCDQHPNDETAYNSKRIKITSNMKTEKRVGKSLVTLMQIFQLISSTGNGCAVMTYF